MSARDAMGVLIHTMARLEELCSIAPQGSISTPLLKEILTEASAEYDAAEAASHQETLATADVVERAARSLAWSHQQWCADEWDAPDVVFDREEYRAWARAALAACGAQQ